MNLKAGFIFLTVMLLFVSSIWNTSVYIETRPYDKYRTLKYASVVVLWVLTTAAGFIGAIL